MTKIKIKNIDDAKLAGKKLLQKGIKNCVITLGENGAYFINEEKAKYLPPFKIDKVKASVAAGDAFTGILGASISSGLDIFDSLEIAIIGSALSTTKNGAQESMPYYSEIIKELD